APARGTSATAVPRVHDDERNAGVGTFVCEEEPQLMEGPARMFCSPLVSNRGPIPDPRQVFDDHSATGALSSSDNSLRDDVVDVCRATMFLLSPLDEKAAGAARAEFLKALAEASGAFPQSTQCATRVERAIAVRGDIPDSQVHSEKVGRL